MLRMLPLFLLMSAGFAAAADKKVVAPKDFPAGRPYSAGIQVGDTLYVSGQTGNNPATNSVPQNFEDEVRQCLTNVGAILKAGGYDYSDVVAVQVYLTDMDLFQRMNAVYTSIFKEPRPTRTTVGIARLVQPAMRIEITVTARK